MQPKISMITENQDATYRIDRIEAHQPPRRNLAHQSASNTKTQPNASQRSEHHDAITDQGASATKTLSSAWRRNQTPRRNLTHQGTPNTMTQPIAIRRTKHEDLTKHIKAHQTQRRNITLQGAPNTKTPPNAPRRIKHRDAT